MFAGDAVLADVGDEPAVAPVAPPFVERNELLRAAVVDTARSRSRSAGRPAGRPDPTSSPAIARAPRDAAVGRRDHAHVVAGAGVVPLAVAVAVVRALRPRVARDPGLVPEGSRRECRRDRVRQVRPPSVERLTSRMGRCRPRRSRGRDQPDVVLRVVGHRRVADPRPRAAGVGRSSSRAARRSSTSGRRSARSPRRGCSSRRRRTSGRSGSATIVLPEGERVGLELRPVLVLASGFVYGSELIGVATTLPA